MATAAKTARSEGLVGRVGSGARAHGASSFRLRACSNQTSSNLGGSTSPLSIRSVLFGLGRNDEQTGLPPVSFLVFGRLHRDGRSLFLPGLAGPQCLLGIAHGAANAVPCIDLDLCQQTAIADLRGRPRPPAVFFDASFFLWLSRMILDLNGVGMYSSFAGGQSGFLTCLDPAVRRCNPGPRLHSKLGGRFKHPPPTSVARLC